MALDSGSYLRVPSWLNTVERCRDCSVRLKEIETERCWYCTQHPYKMKGVCANCDGVIYDQHEMRFKLFGNFCFTCDLRAELKKVKPSQEPTLF